MTRPTFAYIVQLDLPGGPIKIGHSSNLVSRVECFNNATPVSLRIIGATISGKAREAEMLAATNDRVLKGEWRLPTPALSTLTKEYFLRGEWFTKDRPLADVWARYGVWGILHTHKPDLFKVTKRPSNQIMQYWPAKAAVAALAETLPALGLHMCGYDRASHAPSFDWPQTESAAA